MCRFDSERRPYGDSKAASSNKVVMPLRICSSETIDNHSRRDCPLAVPGPTRGPRQDDRLERRAKLLVEVEATAPP
jgi:hypothetical protein